MSRYNESMGVAPNPSQFYLEWNSEKAAFCYYDKEQAERIPMPLPFRFLALKFMNCVTGYDETFRLGIYSNEVADTRYDSLRVARRDGSVIAEGLYSQIKAPVKNNGGHYTKSIYAMSQRGVIINIKLTGSQLIAFDEIAKHGNRWKDEWIGVAKFETREWEGKPYTVPVFQFAGSVNVLDKDRAEDAYATVKNYFDSRQHAARPQPAAPQPVAAAQPEPQLAWQAIDDDDLPF